MSAVEFGLLFKVGNFGTALSKSIQKLLTDLGVCHLTAAEAHSDLDAVAFLEELDRAAHFGVQVIGVDAGRHTNLLDFNNVLIFLCFLFLFELVEAEFTVVHDLTDRGNGIGRDLDEVKLLLFSHCQRFLGGKNAEHCTVSTDQTDFLIPNIFIELMI